MKTEVYPALSLLTQLTLPLCFLYTNKEESFSWTGCASSSVSLNSKDTTDVWMIAQICASFCDLKPSLTADYCQNVALKGV